MNLVDIASGWMNFINADPKHKEMIAFRLAVCDKCNSKGQLSPLGKVMLKAINEEASIYYCKKCNCPLASKTANMQSICPLHKWTYWISPQTFY